MIDHNHTGLHWAYKYLGLPYAEGANGPDKYDCWGLVRRVCAEQIDCEMPLLNIGRDDNADAIKEAIVGWVKVDPPYQELDVLTMRSALGRHIGVCIKANGKIMMLHAEVPVVQVVELNRFGTYGYKDVQGWRYERQ